MTARATTRETGGRDLRLDLVRGLTMLVIFIAHVPNNLWADYIPARLGFSSGAEIFVLCSGIASGLAFGATFARKGLREGCRRIGKRILQLYGAHLALIVVLGGLALVTDAAAGRNTLAIRYDLAGFVSAPAATMLAYAALLHVPAFFDILPLYIVLLGFVPLVMLAARRPLAILAVSFALWLAVLATRWGLPNLATGDVWYFNPFAWQFLFFLGFGWARGWWPVPRPNRPWLVTLCATYVLAAIPLTFWAINDGSVPLLAVLHEAIYPQDAITVLHPTGLLHVMALAYLVLCLLEPARDRLSHPVLRPLVGVGQNSFATFLIGLALSMIGGIVIDHVGVHAGSAAIINLAGLLALLAAGSILGRDGRRPAKAATPPPGALPQPGHP